MTNAEKNWSLIPVLIPTIIGYAYFVFTLLMNLFSNIKTEICWQAGILCVIGYGFIYIGNFMENAHSGNIGK